MKVSRLSLALVALLVMGSAPVASARVPDHVQIERAAHGFWRIGPRGADRFTAVGAFVWGERGEDEPADEALFGALFRMRCIHEKVKNGSMTTCRGTAGVHGELTDREFQMDPLMRAASLELKNKGTTYRVAWEAAGPAGFYSATEGCVTLGSNGEEEESGEGHGGGSFQPATATVDAFGHELTSKGFFGAFMETGVMITECDMKRNLDAMKAGDFSKLRFVFPR
ncbi:MAG: hypothetical protein M3N53_01210 [Actinomycetota bacterium]|nr:hypothetical protein [Actinomycetota bacterium]